MTCLVGKTALVTGGARGIGAAICRHYAQHGARVAIADLRAGQARETAASIGANTLAVPLDVADPVAIAETIQSVEESLGGIDILVNGAAIFNMAPIAEIGFDDYRQQFDVNVGGTIFVTRAVVPGMRARGRGGAIINFASQAGRRGEPHLAIYCATKAAIISLTQSFALELAPDNIRVNAIAPGVVDTPMWDKVDGLFAKYEQRPPGEKKRLVGKAVPLGRMGQPDDIAEPCVFLACDQARYITAQTLNVDGGNWMS